jgi:small subunit ribosomal protein S20
MAKDQSGKEKEKAPKKKRPTPLKRDEQSIKRNERNRVIKSRVSTAARGLEEAIKKGDQAETQAKLSQAHSMLDKAAQKGVLHKNTASRKKARLSAKTLA